MQPPRTHHGCTDHRSPLFPSDMIVTMSVGLSNRGTGFHVAYTPNEPRHGDTITHDGGCDSARPVLADLRDCLLQTTRTSAALHAAANWLTATIPDGDGRVQSMPDEAPSRFVCAR